jgi:hypothetical protein
VRVVAVPVAAVAAAASSTSVVLVSSSGVNIPEKTSCVALSVSKVATAATIALRALEPLSFALYIEERRRTGSGVCGTVSPSRAPRSTHVFSQSCTLIGFKCLKGLACGGRFLANLLALARTPASRVL